MIRRLYGYLFRQSLVAFIFATAAVSFVVLFVQSFRFLSFIIDNAGTAVVFLQLMGLLIPTFLPLVAPISLGIGILFIYHKFAVDSELVVMESAGISPLHLARPALALAAGVALFGYLLTLWLTPAANRELVALQYKVKDSYSAYLIRPGAFNDLADGLTFFARGRDSDGDLVDILVHDVRHPEAPVTIMAQRGQLVLIDGQPQIVVFNGRRQEITPKTGHLSQLAFDRYVLDLQMLRADTAAKRLPDPREQTVSELIDAMRHPSAPHRATPERVRSEFIGRLATPLLAFGYTLIGLTAILVGAFNRRGMTGKIVIAVLADIALQSAVLWQSSLVGHNGWMIPVLFLSILSPIPVCLYLLTRGPRRPPATPPKAAS